MKGERGALRRENAAEGIDRARNVDLAKQRNNEMKEEKKEQKKPRDVPFYSN